MQQDHNKRWEPSLHIHSIGNEIRSRLRELIETARADLQPRDFAERHLVDELAICKWRQLRVLAMQTAIYQHEQDQHVAEYGTLDDHPEDPDNKDRDPLHDMYFFAMCHAPDRHGIVLAALARLETRYHRHFCTTLRLLTALRSQNPFAVPQAVN